jgi:hypothetical protein
MYNEMHNKCLPTDWADTSLPNQHSLETLTNHDTPSDYCMFCEGRWLPPLTDVGIMIITCPPKGWEYTHIHPECSRTHVAAMYPSPIFKVQVLLTLCRKVPQTTNIHPPTERPWIEHSHSTLKSPHWTTSPSMSST